MLENEKNEMTETEVETAETDENVVEEASGEADITEEIESQTDCGFSKRTPGVAVRFLSGLFDYVEILAFSVCIVLIAFTLLGRLCRVSGDSMNKTLLTGEMLLISNLVEVEQEDIVVFHMTTDNASYSFLNEPLVKRVIAKGGQTVEINFDTCQVSVDGKVMDDKEYAYLDIGYYGDYVYHQSGVIQFTVPEGHLFVMGDNRNNSIDSRSTAVGFVDERRVLGKVICRLSPFTWFN